MISYLLEHYRYSNIIGILVILGIALLFSKNRKAISLTLIARALILQVGIALLVLKTTMGCHIIECGAAAIAGLYHCADDGITFLFGSLANPGAVTGFIFAIRVLPVIIFFGAFMGLLFYLRIVQKVVFALNKIVQPLIGSSATETLCAVANSFLGQTEAPLLIRHYLATMTHSELLTVMVSGMGTISSAILAVYAIMGVPAVHLLTSSVMAIPATILIAKILLPETNRSTKEKSVVVEVVDSSKNAIDAVARGTSDGLQLALNVGAMLIAFLALISLINIVLGVGCSSINKVLVMVGSSFYLPDCITLQAILGTVFAPFGWLLGLRGNELLAGGSLIGTKVAVNEMVAYTEMVHMHLSDRAIILLTYALCGFSNFACIGIQVGGIGALVPERRSEISSLGLYAVLGGMLSNLLSAMIVGLIL